MEHRTGFFIIVVATLLVDAPVRAQNITYIDPVTDATIAAKESHTSSEYLVGAIAGSHGVTATGGATYSIPIFSPPGTNGLQPSLSLVYNSQGGDGPLGMGWNIAGLSAISRVGSDNYHDGVTAPVTFTTADHFALDGQRLVPTNGGTYGAAGTEYDTEAAQFMRVTTPDMNGTCPSSFKVQDKSCNVRWYGLVEGSNAQFDGNQSYPYSWYLNRIVDPYGNQVQYRYDMDAYGGPMVTEIRWGGTTSTFEGVNKIEFIYEERSDMSVRRTHAMEVISTRLLNRIHVYGDGVLVRQYELRYAQGALDRSCLSEMVEYGLDGKQYNTSVFQYPNEEPWYVGGYDGFVEITPAGLKQILTGDFDGDGRMDRAYANYELVTVMGANPPYNLARNYTSIQIQIGNSSWATFDIEDPSFPGLEFYGIAGRSRQGFFLNDMNGDGRDDIVLSKTTYDQLEDKFALTGMWIWESTTSTSTPAFSFHSIGTPGGPYIYCNPSSSRDPVLVGDFTGDGRAEVLALLHDNDWDQMHSFLRQWGQGWSDISGDIETYAANHLGNCDMDRVVDVDGDGKDEIVALQSDGWQPFRVIGRHANGTWGTIAGLSSPVFSYELNLHIGDLNGDGMQDLIYREAGEWKMRQGYGNGFSLPDPLSLPSGTMAVADLNNDGLADIFHATDQSGQWVVRTGISRGSMLDQFTGNDAPAFEWQTQYPVNPMGGLVVGDRDGDGAAEVFSYVPGGQLQWFECRPFHEQGALKKVCDGMLNKTTFSYRSTRFDPTYIMNDNQGYPYGDYDGAIHVAHHIQEPDGNGLTYRYGDGVAWKNGPGFIGFEKFAVTNSYADRRTESTLLPDPGWAILKPCTTRTVDDSEELLLSESVQMPTIVDLGPSMRRFTVHSEEITSTDELSGVETTVNNVYNSTGDNIVQTTTTVGGLQTVVEDLRIWPFRCGGAAGLRQPACFSRGDEHACWHAAAEHLDR
ncbi:MAG: VCBS repeat-containing protein [Flavobacteriales bacterium]|nr:VCBS repeat-containing protein [Flavobacteriales bacterium]